MMWWYNMRDGWICLHRKILQNPICNKPDYFSLFITLLLLSNHQDNCIIVNNSKTLIKRGQLLTSRLKLSQITGIQESKIERILKYLKSEQQIEQQNLVIGRLITIINYDTYQISEQQNEHGMNSERTANEQRVNTINNNNNVNNDNKSVRQPQFIPPTIEEITKYIRDNNYSVDPNTFLKYFTESNWMDSNNKKVKNWKQKIITWNGRNTPKKSEPRCDLF